ncbi:MAG: MupG family TIM beta-alpha barrel fold protein [Pisciglobus halotolerans]|nr:MupG family TIM beta-alpha barrel fold protein [Pisciglobus halotolerans]
MRKLGISIYPNHSELNDMKHYLDLAAKYGFTRVFSCLLSVEGDKNKVVAEFKEIIDYAKDKGMEVIVDISPQIFERLGASYNDLTFFKEIGADGIRLDEGYTGNEESIMTFNPEDLQIELNISNGTKYLENILSYQPKKENVIGCHNFYPHRYTGLGYDHFIETSKEYKRHGIRTAAFVNSTTAKIGPWPVSEGLCTLEMHRDLPIEVQAKHLWATELIDDVIIANAFASEEELKALSQINPYQLTLRCELEAAIPELEKTIILDECHFNRGDVSDYVIRSTQSRVKYSDKEFPVFNTPEHIERGDIIIESSLYTRYAGELQVALLPMKNSGKSNVAGHIAEDEIPLLDLVKPWQKFKFQEMN